VKHLSTLPSTAEQARHALLLLGAPAPARLVVDVHAALFDGDLSGSGLATLMRVQAEGFGAALRPDLTAVHGLIALAEWPLERRLVTPARQRADALAMILRVAEFVAIATSAGRAADRLLRELAQGVPHGVEAVDLAEATRAALAEPALIAAVEAEQPARAAALQRAAELDPRQQLYGLPTVPHQRGGA
jgi:hypothetical protein